MSPKILPSSTMLLLASLLLPALSLAASTAVATDPILTTITSTYYSTTSSSTGTSVSQTQYGTTDSCSTQTDGATVCVAPALAATVVTLYGTSVIAVTTKVVSTVGYSTEYSSVADAATTSSKSSSSTETTSTTPATTSSSDTVVGTSSTTNSQSSATPATSSTRNSIAPASATTSSAASARSSSNDLGPKVALAVAIVVGLIFISLAAGYVIKKRRDRRFKRSIGAPQPGSVEKGGMISFVAMNEVNKKPQASTTTLPTIPESRPETATPTTEQLATNVRDPPVIGANPVRLSGLNQHSPTFPPAAYEAQGAPVFEAPPRPSISADDLPPRAGSLHQRRASTESARMAMTPAPVEVSGNSENEICTNPFHEPQCNCRKSAVMPINRNSVYASFGQQQRHEIGGESRFEAGGNQVHEAGGSQWFEAQGNPRYEMMAAPPAMELEDTSTGIGTAR